MAKPENYVYDAQALFQSGQYDQAAQTLHNLELQGYFSPAALDLKSMCYLHLEKYEEAFIAANMALKYEQHGQLYGHRGHALHMLGLIKEAKSDYEKGAALGDEACRNNIRVAIYDRVEQTGLALERAKRGELSLDLNNYFFISDQHDRYENNRLIQKNPNSNRAIRIKTNIWGGQNYSLIIYNLDEVHPTWKNYVQVAPKQMKIKTFNGNTVDLIGYGNDEATGEPFSNYALLINMSDNSISLKLLDRNVEIIYHSSTQL